MDRLLFNDGVSIYSKDWEKQFDSIEDYLKITMRYLFEGATQKGGIISGYEITANADNPIDFDITHGISNPEESIGIALDKNGNLLVSTSSGVVGLALSDSSIGVTNVVAVRRLSYSTGLDPKTGLPAATKRVSASDYQSYDVFTLEGIEALVYSLTEWYSLPEDERNAHVQIGQVVRISDTALSITTTENIYLGAKLGLETIYDQHVSNDAQVKPTKIANVELEEDPVGSGIYREKDDEHQYFGTGAETPANLQEFLYKIITQIKKILGGGLDWDVEEPPSLEQVDSSSNRFRRSGTLPNEREDFDVTISKESFSGDGAEIRVGPGINLAYGNIKIIPDEQVLTVRGPDVLDVGTKRVDGVGQPTIGAPEDYGEIVRPGNITWNALSSESERLAQAEADAVQLVYSAIVSGTLEILDINSNNFLYLEQPPTLYNPLYGTPTGFAILNTSTGMIYRPPGAFQHATNTFYIKYSAYMSRWDLLYFDPLEREFKILEGEPGDDPVKPLVPPNQNYIALKYIFIDKYSSFRYNNTLQQDNIVDFQTFATSLPYQETAITSSTGVTNVEELGLLTFYSGYTLEPLISSTYPLGLIRTSTGETALNELRVPTPEQNIASTVNDFGTNIVQGTTVLGQTDWETAGKRKTTTVRDNTFAGIRLFLGNEDDVYVLADSGPAFDDIEIIIESSTGKTESKLISRATTDQTNYYKVPGTSATGSFLAGYYTLKFQKYTDDDAPITILKVIWGQINFEAEIGEFESILVQREIESGVLAKYISMSVGAVKQLILGSTSPNVDVLIPGNLTIQGSTTSSTVSELNVTSSKIRVNQGTPDNLDGGMDASRRDALVAIKSVYELATSAGKDWLVVDDTTSINEGDEFQVYDPSGGGGGGLNDTGNAQYYPVKEIIGTTILVVYDDSLPSNKGLQISTPESGLTEVRGIVTANASILWQESSQRWLAGLATDLKKILREGDRNPVSFVTGQELRGDQVTSNIRVGGGLYTGDTSSTATASKERIDSDGRLKNISSAELNGKVDFTGSGATDDLAIDVASGKKVRVKGTLLVGTPEASTPVGGKFTPYSKSYASMIADVAANARETTSGDFNYIVLDSDFIAKRSWNSSYNDYADWQLVADNEKLIPGKCYYDTYFGAKVCTKRCQKSVVGIYSDTFGHSVGKRKTNDIPISVAGWVLAYVDRLYLSGTPLVNDKNGNLTKARLYEKIFFPERIVAIYKKKEPCLEWGPDKVKVNNRCWVKVK